MDLSRFVLLRLQNDLWAIQASLREKRSLDSEFDNLLKKLQDYRTIPYTQRS